MLVSCELFALPQGLKDKALWIFNRRWKDLRSEEPGLLETVADPNVPQSVIMAATHTHQSPGNFISAHLYNEFGSSYSGITQGSSSSWRDESRQ